MASSEPSLADAQPWTQVGAEISRVLRDVDARVVDDAAAFLDDRPGRWFFTGQGRSGLVAQMAAMRLMHLGRSVHFVGEPTAPSIDSGDHLVAFSSSGGTAITLHLARIAELQGADLLAVCSRANSQLAQLADRTLLVPTGSSNQFGGSLFEQCALIVFDALILRISGGGEGAYEAMQRRHANLQ